MKKIILITCAILIFTSSNIFAVNGDIIGDVYSTDILAYINNEPIKSYNIGGRTAIIAEDLSEYGFDVKWDENSRILTVNTITDYKIEKYENNNIEKKEDIIKNSINIISGKSVGKIYSTDIVTIINGVLVPSYNIGGRTIIVLEDIGVEKNAINFSRISPPDNIEAPGYTLIGFRTEWDNKNRTIKTYVARHQSGIITCDMGDVKIIDVINPKDGLYYGGRHKVYEVENPNNEYAKIHSIDYGAIIPNITFEYTMNSIVKNVDLFLTEALFGYMGINYTFENELINIITTNNTTDISLKVLSYNLYNEQYLKAPLYSTNIKIAVNGEIVIMPADMCIAVVEQSELGYFLYINIEALEIALETKIFH